ncbi:MAG: regulatory protein RecX [Methylococcaceae bacterium]|jgi:regulatory protein|nr:MAG: regulatory protein RecX [Methylococcaceae bacterium]
MDAERKAIKEMCLRLLARREHSQKELLAKCRVKNFVKQTVLEVLAELAEQGWQDDARFVESYVRSRKQKGFGPLLIAQQVRLRVAAEHVTPLLDQDAEESWFELIMQVYKKKYPQDLMMTSALLSPQELAKRQRFLLQRGFPAELIRTLFAHLIHNKF